MQKINGGVQNDKEPEKKRIRINNFQQYSKITLLLDFFVLFKYCCFFFALLKDWKEQEVGGWKNQMSK